MDRVVEEAVTVPAVVKLDVMLAALLGLQPPRRRMRGERGEGAPGEAKAEPTLARKTSVENLIVIYFTGREARTEPVTKVNAS